MDPPREPAVRAILWSAVILAGIFAISLASLQPPAPRASDALSDPFSAIRAANALHRILGDDAPHPVGSLAGDTVRGKIVAELTSMGYQPQIQTAFACGDFGQCATVNNVLTRLDGSEPGAAVLLAAHYDSVPAGPGDSDDGTGVAAVIEIARALKALPTPRHTVIFLLDEGEEAGLLGARAFVDSHPWAKEVRAAVNLDARGTSGPSALFETGSANDWAAQLYARHAPRPVASSIFYTLYKHLPNDTDFTVFKAAGYQGLNFAYFGDVARYHTPLDNSSNVSLASLEHHGKNALPAIIALANADLSNIPQQEAVFFDLFGRWVVRWPAHRSPVFALCITVLLIMQFVWMIRRTFLAPARFLWGMIAWLTTMAATSVMALITAWLTHLTGATPVNWVAYPLALEMTFWALAILVATTSSIFFEGRAGFWGLWSGVWTWWALLAVVTSLLAPGVSYLFLVPLGVTTIVVLPFALARNRPVATLMWLSIVSVAAGAVVGFGPVNLLYAGLGNRGLVLIALTVGVLLTPLAPLFGHLRNASCLYRLAFIGIPLALTAIAAFAATVAPAYSAKTPERVNIEYWQDADSGKAQWIVQPDSGRLPAAMRPTGNFQRADRGALPWDTRTAYITSAPALDMPAPTFTLLDSAQVNGRRTYHALLRSERAAPFAAVLFPPDSDVDSFEIEGAGLETESYRVRQFFNGWAAYSCSAIPGSGVEISFSAPVGRNIEVSAVDETYGLPSQGSFLLSARPATATPSQDGDVTIVTRRVELLP